METQVHRMSDLFDQLGLPSDSQAIEDFISKNKSKTSNQSIDQLEIWTPAQAAFLKQAWVDDADWAEVVDELSARLSKH